MNIKIILSRILFPACLFFTLLTLASTAIATAAGYKTLAPTLKTLLVFFLFSVVVSALNQIFYVKPLGSGLKILIHYLGFIVSFLVIFLLIRTGTANSVGALIILLALSVLYFIIAGIALLILHSRKKAVNEKKKYDNVFIGK